MNKREGGSGEGGWELAQPTACFFYIIQPDPLICPQTGIEYVCYLRVLGWFCLFSEKVVSNPQ